MAVNLHVVTDTTLPLATALHHFRDLTNAPFDIHEYSRMKFGSNRAAKRFGYALADDFASRFMFALETPCVVIPAPSTTVSVAATMLAQHFRNRLNAIADRKNFPSVEWTLIHRNMTYNNNYAHLPKEERKELLAKDTIFLNREYVEGKTLLFVDDVRITGTHEEKIIDFLDNRDINNPKCFVTFAIYDGDDPAIEGRLNHVEIKDWDDLVRLSHETDFEITTRGLRLFLEAPTKDFPRLLRDLVPGVAEKFYYGAIVKGYNRHEPYTANMRLLRTHCGK